MLELLKNIKTPRNWVIEIDANGISFDEEDGYEAMLTAFWLYRFGFFGLDRKVNVYFKEKLLKSFSNEEEAMQFFKQKYPRSSDFVWKDRVLSRIK